MRCVLWRQHRGQLLWTAAVLGVACVFMLAVAHSANQWLTDYNHWLTQLRAAGCPVPARSSRVVDVPASCHALLSRYPGGEQSSFAHAYNFAVAVFEEGLVVLLVITAALVGAPLVAREVEQRTQLVAWTQSISRRRWYVTKTTTLAAVLTLAGLLAGIANDHLQIPLTRGGLTSSRWPWFFSIDFTPAAETLLAFALAVALGAFLRRTQAAIGAALISFLICFLTAAWAVRSLTPLSHAASGRGAPNGSWIIGGSYHPAHQFWSLQLTDAATLTLISAALLAAGWRATRPRNVV